LVFYFLSAIGITVLAVILLEKTILPAANDGQFQLRLRAPPGLKAGAYGSHIAQAQDVLY